MTLLFLTPQPWMEDALCSQVDPNVFFPDTTGGSYRAAKMVCYRCPVREQCLEYALRNNENFGVWGGLSDTERKKLRRGQGRLLQQCANGHDLAVVGIDSYRNCRQCAKERYARYNERVRNGHVAVGKPHGYSKYRAGCRCDICREASRVHQRELREARKEAQ